MNKISIVSLDKKFNSHVKTVSALSRKIFLSLKKDGFGADIYLISDRRMKFLNRKYRHKNMATNVLSFCEPKGFISVRGRCKHLGEIYIAPDFIKKNKQDIRQMVTHGILHLLGYNHTNRVQRVKMERLENRIITRL